MVNGRTKGLTAERDLANYLKAQGWPEARRSVVTGTFARQDSGDIEGLPGLCVQVKNLATGLSGKLLHATWHQTQAQAEELTRQRGHWCAPLIVEKRAGSADPGRWWCHLSSRFYVRVITGRWMLVTNLHLVRVELGDIVTDLRLWSTEIEQGFQVGVSPP